MADVDGSSLEGYIYMQDGQGKTSGHVHVERKKG